MMVTFVFTGLWWWNPFLYRSHCRWWAAFVVIGLNWLRTAFVSSDSGSQLQGWEGFSEGEGRRCHRMALRLGGLQFSFPLVVVVAFLSWTLWGSPGVCTHTRTSTGALRRVRGLRVQPFPIIPPCRQLHCIFVGIYFPLVKRMLSSPVKMLLLLTHVLL